MTKPERKVPVLLELFTSEGCSSCPPADSLMAQIVAQQPIAEAEVIALEEHVDYWNHLGWTDPFSSPQFTERQKSYAWVFQTGSVYTPQMVVDGSRELVGSQERLLRQAIAQAAATRKTPVLLQQVAPVRPGELSLEVSIPGLGNAGQRNAGEVYLAVTEDGLESAVRDGENAGRHLSHAAVVRLLLPLGKVSASAPTPFAAAPRVKLAPGWKHPRLRAVVFVQERKSRRILGVASIPME